MSSRTYHGELTPDFMAAEPGEDPWLDDKTTAQYGVEPSIRQRADAEIARFWRAQDTAARAKISQRKLDPRWIRALAVLLGALLCGAFARVLLSPDASFSRILPLQPSAAPEP